MNYLRGIISLFLLGALLSSGTLPVRLAAEDAVHVVARGETVYSISRSYRVSPEELMRYNSIGDASKLQAGQRLRIPPLAFSGTVTGSSAAAEKTQAAGRTTGSATQSAGGRAGYTEYRVVKNDTLYSIARTHGVSVEALRETNQFSASYVLKEGTRIKIPSSGTSGAAKAPANSTTAPSGKTGTAIQPPARQTTSKTVDSSLRWPVMPKSIAYMTGKLYGVVVQGERSESVRSLTQGTVISAGPYRGFGRVAIVQVSGGYLYVYGGCESLSVKEGDRIGPGTELGRLGIDAVSEKPQLFFMVYRSNTPIDPAKAPRA
jgi:murein DD-endopeptidase MepM/ murein hydrolase activator NlpD